MRINASSSHYHLWGLQLVLSHWLLKVVYFEYIFRGISFFFHGKKLMSSIIFLCNLKNLSSIAHIFSLLVHSSWQYECRWCNARPCDWGRNFDKIQHYFPQIHFVDSKFKVRQKATSPKWKLRKDERAKNNGKTRLKPFNHRANNNMNKIFRFLFLSMMTW